MFCSKFNEMHYSHSNKRKRIKVKGKETPRDEDEVIKTKAGRETSLI